MNGELDIVISLSLFSSSSENLFIYLCLDKLQLHSLAETRNPDFSHFLQIFFLQTHFGREFFLEISPIAEEKPRSLLRFCLTFSAVSQIFQRFLDILFFLCMRSPLERRIPLLFLFFLDIPCFRRI